ncbi:MAG: HAMP domain-containing protein [Hyphomicrobiales bacterium]|nr:HAMP domain-containing protein [Hyphomicrobiales bacterium]
MSLRLQLILLTTLVLLVSLLLGGLLTYGYARSKVRAEMHAAMAVGQRMARNAITDAGLDAEPDRKLRQLVADFDGDRHLRVSWTNEAGGIVASSELAPALEFVPDWLYRLLAGPPNIVRLPMPAPLHGRGSIELETDPHNEIGEAWEDVRLLLAILGIFCGLVLSLTFVAVGYAFRPLQRLSAAFTRVGGGDYTQHVAENGPLELSRLCGGFNRMLDRLSDMESRNLKLQEQLAAVQDEERADLARDLHDEVGPFLFAVGVDATMIKRFAGSGEREEIMARSDAIREATEHMQKHIRAMLGRLRAGALLDVGLNQAVENLVTFWRTRQPEVTFEMHLPKEAINHPLDEVVYRTIQESLSNAVRHGRPRWVEIRVQHDVHDVLVTVEDDGAGFQPSRQKTGYGLAGMEERIKALGGKLAIGVRQKGGVIVSARLPRKDIEEAEPAILSPALTA